MKTSVIPRSVDWLRITFLIFALCLGGASEARAGLTVDVHLYHDTYGYYFYPWLNTDGNSPGFPDGYYMIASPQIPTNGSQLQYVAANNTLSYVTGGGNYYNNFGSFLYGITNGLWSILVTNTTSTNLYTFTVSVSGVSSNFFGAPSLVIFPINNALLVTNQPFFQWSGPVDWSGTLNVSDYFVDTNGANNYEASDLLSSDQTSWPCPVVLPNGTNTFSADYVVDGSTLVVASTPVNSSAQAISAWTSTSTLETSFNSQFTVGQPTASGGGHTLVADYTFDNSGYLGQDSSANGNNMDGSSSWGVGMAQILSMDAEAGDGAIQFFGTSSLTPDDQVLTNIDTVLAGSFTFSGWVNTTNSVGNDYDNAYFGATIYWAFNDHSATNDTIPLSITGSKAAFTTRDHAGNFTTIHSLTSVNDGHYHLITVTRNQGSGEMRVYVDGNFEASAFGSTDPLNGNNYYLSVGGTSLSSYTGLLDDLQIYSGVLSDTEIAGLYGDPGTTVPNVAGGSPDFNGSLGTTNLNWQSSGDAGWLIETTNTYNTASAAQSGSVTGNQSSTLSVTVTGPGTLTFDWSSMANGPDFDCEFAVDNNDYDDLFGDTPWYQDGSFAIPAGQHTLSWTAFAYGDTDPTEAAFLAQVSYVQNIAPIITLNPFNQTNSPGYNVALLAAATNSIGSAITWQWFDADDAAAISGATNALFIPADSGTAGVAGSYYAVVSTAGGSVNTTTALVSFVTAALPPRWSYAAKSPFSAVDSTTVTKDYYLGCAVDAAGEVYVSAEYTGSMDVLTNGNVENVLTSVGSGGGAALVKHAANGSPIWAVGLTNNAVTSSSYGIAVAPAPGNGAYLAASVVGTNWLGTNQFADVAGGSLVLSRFGTGGSNVWSRFMTGSNLVVMNYGMLAADSSGNVTLSGNFSGTASLGGTNLSVTGGAGFIVQFDTNGVVRWAESVPDNLWGLAYGNGLLYVSIQTTVSGGVTNVSVGSLSNLTDRAWAVACLNATNGQVQWVRGVGEVYGANPIGTVFDVPFVSAAGTNVFIVGNAYGTSAEFGNLTISLPGSGQYFARYDTNGNPLTATAFGSPTTTIWAVAANNSGVYISGDFNDESQFGNEVIAAPVNGTNDLGPIYFTQPFIAKFDVNGNPLWSRNGVSSDFANFRGIALATDGVWADGFLKIANSVPAHFDAFNVDSDSQTIGAIAGGGISLLWNQGGLLTKITESNLVGSAVTLLSPQDKGTNFQFQFLSESGFNHNILYRTNLFVGSWQTNSTVVGDGTVKTISIPLSVFGPASQGYIRVSTQ